LAADRGSCGNGWRADSAIVIRNYVPEDVGIFGPNPSGTEIRETGCASLSSGPNGGLNHVEIRVSQNQVDVYASDAGTRTPLRLINTITNANLSFTRGLVWIQDVHYNAEKAFIQDPTVPNQINHTYAWDNVAFDGPATYRDLSFDVLDGTTAVGGGVYRIGWDTSPSTPANLTTLPMTAANIAAATSALLVFDFGKDTTPSMLNYTINGNPNSVPYPLPPSARGWRNLAVPVPLSQLVAGPQNIRLASNVNLWVQNVTIILVAAAPVPGFMISPTNLRIVP